MEKKLKFLDYVFEVNSKNVFDASLEMKLSGITSHNYQTKEVTNYECIDFDIYGVDDKGNDCAFGFVLSFSREDLKKLDKKVINLYDYVKDRNYPELVFESFLKYPGDDSYSMFDFDFENDTERSMNNRVSTIYVLREDEDIFRIKLQGDPDLFLWFRFNINDIEESK